MNKALTAILLVFLFASNLTGSEKLQIFIKASYARDELRKIATTETASIVFIGEEGPLDPVSVPLSINEEKTEFLGEADRKEIQDRRWVYLRLNMSTWAIFSYYLGEIERDDDEFVSSFDFHSTPVSIDLTKHSFLKEVVEEVDSGIPGNLDIEGSRGGFQIHVDIEKSMLGKSRFLSLPTGDYGITLTLFPKYSKSDTRKIQLKSRNKISYQQGEALLIKLSDKDHVDSKSGSQ